MSSFNRTLLQLLVFLAFFPYPAIMHFGNGGGVQISQILTVIILLYTVPWVLQARSMLAFLSLVVPLYVSLGALAFFSRGDVDLSIRATVLVTLVLSILPVGGGLMRHARPEWLITPVSAAMCIHATVGVWQYRAFSQGTFPLLWIFQNPSFADLQNISKSYALYVARPFGLFPEPSAMAAAVGPWILFLLWYGLKPGGKAQIVALVGAVAGSSLILLSQSIYAVFLLPCAFMILLMHRRSSARRMSVFETLIWGLCALGAILFPILSSTRIDIRTNASTQGRISSLVEGIGLPLNGISSILFGVGPGQSFRVLGLSHGDVTAIYSVVVSAFAEGGLIAFVGMACVTLMWVKKPSSGYRHVFLLAWVAGIAFSTSYASLESIWLFLAMMLDLEFKSESSPHNPDSRLGRGGAALGVSSHGAR